MNFGLVERQYKSLKALVLEHAFSIRGPRTTFEWLFLLTRHENNHTQYTDSFVEFIQVAKAQAGLRLLTQEINKVICNECLNVSLSVYLQRFTNSYTDHIIIIVADFR